MSNNREYLASRLRSIAQGCSYDLKIQIEIIADHVGNLNAKYATELKCKDKQLDAMYNAVEYFGTDHDLAIAKARELKARSDSSTKQPTSQQEIAKLERLKEVIRNALRIKSLWLPVEADDDHYNENVALMSMHASFIEALEDTPTCKKELQVEDANSKLNLPKYAITVNGTEILSFTDWVSYETLIHWAGYEKDRVLSVTFRNALGHPDDGIISPGMSVRIKDGTVFDVADTSNA